VDDLRGKWETDRDGRLDKAWERWGREHGVESGRFDGFENVVSDRIVFNENDQRHLYHNPTHEHHLDLLVKNCGGKEEVATEKIIRAAQEHIREKGFSREAFTKTGVEVTVDGFKIIVKGDLVGIGRDFRIGTAFMKE
jgi:hypothetical protein